MQSSFSRDSSHHYFTSRLYFSNQYLIHTRTSYLEFQNISFLKIWATQNTCCGHVHSERWRFTWFRFFHSKTDKRKFLFCQFDTKDLFKIITFLLPFLFVSERTYRKFFYFILVGPGIPLLIELTLLFFLLLSFIVKRTVAQIERLHGTWWG